MKISSDIDKWRKIIEDTTFGKGEIDVGGKYEYIVSMELDGYAISVTVEHGERLEQGEVASMAREKVINSEESVADEEILKQAIVSVELVSSPRNE